MGGAQDSFLGRAENIRLLRFPQHLTRLFRLSCSSRTGYLAPQHLSPRFIPRHPAERLRSLARTFFAHEIGVQSGLAVALDGKWCSPVGRRFSGRPKGAGEILYCIPRDLLGAAGDEEGS